MESPREFRKDDLNLRVESLAQEGFNLLSKKIEDKMLEIEKLGYDIISTEKEMGGDDEFGNPAPEARHGAYSIVLQELKKKRDILQKELKNLINEQVQLEESDRKAVDNGDINQN